MISMRCICWDCSTSSASRMVEALHFLSAGAEGQFRLRRMRCRISGWRCMRPDASTRRSQAIAMRCSWRRIIRKFSTISAMPISSSVVSTTRWRATRMCWRAQPAHVGALVNRGNALLRLNQPVEAIASYDDALTADARPSADPDQSRSCAAPARPAASRRWRTSRRRSWPRRNLPKPISKRR